MFLKKPSYLIKGHRECRILNCTCFLVKNIHLHYKWTSGKMESDKKIMKWPLKPLREHLILFIATHIPSAKHCYNIMCSPTWKLETNSAPSWWNYIYNGWITNKIMFYSCIICLVYRLWDDNQFMISDVSGCVCFNLITDSTVYILCVCVCYRNSTFCMKVSMTLLVADNDTAGCYNSKLRYTEKGELGKSKDISCPYIQDYVQPGEKPQITWYKVLWEILWGEFTKQLRRSVNKPASYSQTICDPASRHLPPENLNEVIVVLFSPNTPPFYVN